MTGFLPTFALLIVGLFAVARLQRRFDATERKFVWIAFLGHVVAAFLQVLLTKHFFGGGDLFSYYTHGSSVADWFTSDIGRNFIPLAKLILHQDPYIPVHLPIRSGATGAMYGITGLLGSLVGKTPYGLCLLMSELAFFGQVAIYLAFRRTFAPRFKKRLLVGALLVPSVVFWSSGLLKETLAMTGLGFLFLGVQGLISQKHRAGSLALAAFGAALVAIVKSYILFPFFIAVGAWYYWQRSLQTKGSVAIVSKPIYLLLGLAVAMGAMVFLGELFPRYSIENIGEELATVQAQQQRITGGSSYSLGFPSHTGLPGQLTLLPLGLASVLFRPLFFEAHNAMALANSVETTVILVAVLRILVKRGVKETYAMITSSPAAMFCMVFVLVFGTMVGLAAPNLGTLSRYRVPMMPFYVTLVLMLVPVGGKRQSRSSS